MAPARLARFGRGITTDRHRCLRLYVWNARLCEEFYLPCQMAEVAIRNAIHNTLTRRFSAAWFDNARFTSRLVEKYRDELSRIATSQKGLRGAAFTENHVVAELTFGFWVHLLTSRYDELLWQGGVFRSFPHAGAVTRDQLHTKVDRLRHFRNKIAHHFAIFDQRPVSEYKNLLELVDMICPETGWLIRQLSNPNRILSGRPQT